MRSNNNNLIILDVVRFKSQNSQQKVDKWEKLNRNFVSDNFSSTIELIDVF